jgi:tRNA uridine 5-carboxymethylaminomethyl modification enzyme
MTGGRFDVIVVGGGHAGCEAAAAAARMGATVALVTLARSTIAQMPCNPAIGGVGKGHLVCELDALGGLQGWAADRAGIQFRLLNASRGPAVWGPRAQFDKRRYGWLLGRLLRRLSGITVIEGEVLGLATDDDRITGVLLAGGDRLAGDAVLLTTGTFLGGRLYTGGESTPGGRFGERPSEGLGLELTRLGLQLRRFKTGTPPRLDRRTLDLARLEVQPGDRTPRPFSWRTQEVRNRIHCWLTRTPPVVQRIVSDNLHRSPLFAGHITGVGPRYCPSIEDKVVRFPHHEEHTVFLEPEGLDTESIYVNGLSTSLPADVQEQIVRSVPGLEHSRFLRYGYAVEYDVVAPLQVHRTMACRSVPGLWFAGQLVGTSGYEEAAALGLVAGINIALRLRGEPPWVPERNEAYIGVLVDDLCSADHREPYRMFTARAEHRLLLGVDSARERLMGVGCRLGLVSADALEVQQRRWQRRQEIRDGLSRWRLNPDRSTRDRLRREIGVTIRAPTTWARLLLRHDVDPERVAEAVPLLAELDTEDRRIVVGLLRYDGYLARHRREIERLRRLRHLEIPCDFDPRGVPGLSLEAIEQLMGARPRTIAEAERLPGITPAALALLVARLAEPSEGAGGCR